MAFEVKCCFMKIYRAHNVFIHRNFDKVRFEKLNLRKSKYVTIIGIHIYVMQNLRMEFL